MSIEKNLYTTSGFKISYPQGDSSLQRIKLSIPISSNDEWYTVIEGDTLTELADRFYKDPQSWYIIADINDIFNPFDDLIPGLELRIPPQSSIDSFNNHSRL